MESDAPFSRDVRSVWPLIRSVLSAFRQRAAGHPTAGEAIPFSLSPDGDRFRAARRSDRFRCHGDSRGG